MSIQIDIRLFLKICILRSKWKAFINMIRTIEIIRFVLSESRLNIEFCGNYNQDKKKKL